MPSCLGMLRSLLLLVALAPTLGGCLDGDNDNGSARQALDTVDAGAPVCDGAEVNGVPADYVPPAEITNPLSLPPGQINAAVNICGAGTHWAQVGACGANDMKGGKFFFNGKVCNIDGSSNVVSMGTTYCCIKCKLDANDTLFNTMGLSCANNVQIAPMKPAGTQNQGMSTNAMPNNVFSAILAAIGIKPNCGSRPEDFKGQCDKGFLEYTKPSDVLNPPGSRATFGYFISFQDCNGMMKTYFILFSYDYNPDSKGKCAMEVFLFGPVNGNNAPPLLLGMAVDTNNQLLTSVPLDIADVGNFSPNGEEKCTSVLPGVSTSNQGCLACHGSPTSSTSRTGPFPWGSDGGQYTQLCDGGAPDMPIPPMPDLGAPPAPDLCDQCAPDGEDLAVPVEEADLSVAVDVIKLGRKLP